MSRALIYRGNDLIAQYMGWRFCGVGRRGFLGLIGKRERYYHHPTSKRFHVWHSYFCYHNDWNMLMEVVRKVEGEIQGGRVVIEKNRCVITQPHFIDKTASSTIVAVFSALSVYALIINASKGKYDNDSI